MKTLQKQNHKTASTRSKVLKPSRFSRSPMRVQYLLRTSYDFPGILEYVNARSEKICGWPIARHSLYCYMCSTLHNYITNRCLQADGHRYCIHPPSIPKETFRYLTVNTFPCLAPPISLSLVVSHWRSNPTPPFTLNPFTLVQQLYSLPTMHIPFPWLPNPRCLYTTWSSRFQRTTEIILFLLGHNITFWEVNNS